MTNGLKFSLTGPSMLYVVLIYFMSIFSNILRNHEKRNSKWQLVETFQKLIFDLFLLWCFVSPIMLPGGGRNSLRVHLQGSSGDRHTSGVSLGHEKHAYLLICSFMW